MDDLLKKIADSAKNIKPPKSLEPEQVIETAKRKIRKRHRSRTIRIAQVTAAAAVLFLCSYTVFHMQSVKQKQEEAAYSKAESKNGFTEGQQIGAGEDSLNGQDPETFYRKSKEAVKQKEVRQDAGDLYKVAKNYSEVRDIVSQDFLRSQEYGMSILNNAGAVDGRYEEESMISGGNNDTSIDSAQLLQDIAKEYSTTNLQTQGVDESDIIKTDGNYIYTLNNSVITIIDIQNGGLEEVAAISLQQPGRELYIDNNRLMVIVQEEISEIRQNKSYNSVPRTEGNNGENNVPEGNGVIDLQEAESDNEKQEDYIAQDCFVEAAIDVLYMDTSIITTLQTYDITDRSQPKLLGEVKQEGGYNTSRKIGDIIYLFTNKYLEMYARPMYDNVQKNTGILENQEKKNTESENDIGNSIKDEKDMENTESGKEENKRTNPESNPQKEENKKEENREEDTTGVPKVNGEVITADSIYLPQRGSQGLIISSISLKNPDTVVDNVMIVHDYVDIYVTTQSLYLYHSQYQQDMEELTTQIAKFQLKDGFINAVAAASALGTVTDTFAIHEEEDTLRLLATRYSYRGNVEDTNCLYIFDNQLQLLGKLEDIAPGEKIYAARYLKDTAYFITYRNMDPLFAADLSNPTQPKLLGEIEITGFSDYLHFWQDNRLLGIGYETDPENGQRKGLKLVMFDITDPVNLSIVTTKVIKGATYSPALENYKYILADREQNIIGITAADYQNGTPKYTYNLFTWTPDEFQSLLTVEYPKTADLSKCRGLYSGKTFYLAMPSEITAYNMENGYQEIAHLELGKKQE